MQVAEPLLPYALAFAAGAMVYVVVDDIIPEAQARFVIGLFDDCVTLLTTKMAKYQCHVLYCR